MAEFLLSEIEISIESEEADIAALLRIIKPSWHLKHLQIKLLSGGYSSRILRCYVKSKEDSVVIRVRNLMDKLYFNEAQNNEGLLELKALHYVSKIGHFTKIHAIFQNGYCYQYIKGKPILNLKERTGFLDDKMIGAIAEEMAFVHSITLDGVSYSDKIIFKHIAAIVESLDPVTFNHNGITKNVMLKEFDLITNFIRSKNYKIVLCHGDPHPGNFVWDKEQGKLTFVDWELSHLGYSMSEIAQFIEVVDLTRIVFSRQNAENIVEDGYHQKLVRYYMEACKKLNNDNTQVTEIEVAQWMEEIATFKLVPLFLILIVGFKYPEIFEQFSGDLSMLDEIIVKNYLKLKEKIFGRATFETE